jgi:uncharacterized protein (UPF0276 family)
MQTLTKPISDIPHLGSGLGYRRELKGAIIEAQQSIDFLEIVADQFMDHPFELDELEELREIFPIIPHGVGLSIGTAAPLDQLYLRSIKQICDVTRAPYFSEHLAMTRVPGINIGHLSPLWFSEEVLATAIDNVRQVQDYLCKPLVLENVTYLFDIPKASMSQAQFFSRLVDASGCGILLDVTNVFVNSVNHHFDPVSFLQEMPLDNIVQIHLAGGYWSQGVLIDGHCKPVDEGSWTLLHTLADLIDIRGCILEQDDDFPDKISDLVSQIARAREIMSNGAGARTHTNRNRA